LSAVVTVVVAILVLLVSLYLVVNFQHPEDKNQAWLPKIVVLLGFSVAFWTILLFPLDVANQQACEFDVPLSSCSSLPMKQLWYALYIANMAIVFIAVPFCIFYYEADSEWSVFRRYLSGFLWALGTVFVMAMLIGIPYAFAGYAEYEVQGARSGLLPVAYLDNGQDSYTNCIGLFAAYDQQANQPIVDGNAAGANTSLASFGYNCDTLINQIEETWKVRVSIIVYAMAVVATLGWLLFMVFGGIGLVALPIDWIRQFIRRPRATITRSQYIDRARELARRAKDILGLADALKREERERGRSWRWRRNTKALHNQLLVLEEDEAQLELVYPQSEDPDYKWVLTVLGFWFMLFGGLLGLALSICWVLQIILYVLIDPPVTPLLNEVFIKANDAFPLFGTLLFGLFAFYLQLAVTKGNFKFGLNLLIFRVHPMRKGATIMSSFLFNVALILLATTATIQFCATAFALYADGTAINDIYGNQLTSIQGLKYLYNENIFIYCMLAFMALALAFVLIVGPDRWKRTKPEDAYAM
jgi:LMBR1 domain-containing protein 1